MSDKPPTGRTVLIAALKAAHRALRNGATDEDRYLAYKVVDAALKGAVHGFDDRSTRLEGDDERTTTNYHHIGDNSCSPTTIR